jgi:hypothetical protein
LGGGSSEAKKWLCISYPPGFRDFVWYPSEVAPEDVVRYGEAYWRDFYDNCLVIGLVCQK